MAEIKKADNNIHKGHRQKVKESYYLNGLDGMADHNIIEFLLFFGIPQKDTNVLAHELIEKFGSFSGVLEAKRSDLLCVKGMTDSAACLISMLLPVYKRYNQDIRKKKVTLNDKTDYVKLLRPLYLDTNNERIYILCLDSNNKLVACRKISEGDFTSSLFDIRKIASAILELNAKKLVLSHNHPNGSLNPSADDCRVTDKIRELCEILKVSFVDHIIITDTSYFSMASSARHIHHIYGGEPLI